MNEAARKRRALRRSYVLATGLLLLAAAIFLSMQFLAPVFAVRLTSAAAEAALVGGLADWFAVTALFRHPLGLPIPHTALIPSRKDEIGRALGHFVRDNFLDAALVIQRLRRDNRALQLARWLKSEKSARFLSERVLALLPLVLEHARDEEIRRFVSRVAQEGLRRIDLAPLADAAMWALLQSGKHMDLVDAAASVIDSSLGALKQSIVDKVGEHTGRFIPKYVDRKIGTAIIRGTQEWLRAVRTLGSEERLEVDLWIRERAAELRALPDYAPLIRNIQGLILSNPALLHAAEAIWDEIKREIAADLDRAEPEIGAVVRRMVQTAGAILEETPALQDYANAALERLIVDYIAPWRVQISDFIAEVVQGWDARTVTALIELEVGRDLQYVRVNGTVVGALIGTLLFLISAAISRA